MEGTRLIRATRHALAEARTVPDALAEAWQACRMTEVLGNWVAASADGSQRTRTDPEEATAGRVAHDEPWLSGGTGELARALADAAGHAAGCLGTPPGDEPEGGRASRLTSVDDPPTVVRELRGLVDETAEALIVLACGADDQELYWRCIDAVDAVAECKELATDLLRALGGVVPRRPAGGGRDAAAAAEPVVLQLPAPPG